MLKLWYPVVAFFWKVAKTFPNVKTWRNWVTGLDIPSQARSDFQSFLSFIISACDKLDSVFYILLHNHLLPHQGSRNNAARHNDLKSQHP